jgi:hypothetical protein
MSVRLIVLAGHVPASHAAPLCVHFRRDTQRNRVDHRDKPGDDVFGR